MESDMFGGSTQSDRLAKKASADALSYIMDEIPLIIRKTIKKYFKENRDVHVSNLSIITTDDESPVEIAETSYVIYCNNVFKHAKNLTNMIFIAGKSLPLNNMVQLRTIIEKEEFWIDYAGRPIIHLLSLTPYKNDVKFQVNYGKALNTMVRDGIHYLPPEIEIVDLYDSIIHMKDIFDEAVLFSACEENFNKSKKGGVIPPCYEVKKEIIDAVKRSIIVKWLPENKDVILIGSWAYNVVKLTMANLCGNPDRVQLITMRDIKSVQKDLEKFVGSLGFKITISNMKTYDVDIPKEERLKRTTFTATVPSMGGLKQKPFLDVYNYTSYDVAPAFKADGVLIGTKPLLLRFMFIELWSAKLQLVFGKLDAHKYHSKISSIWSMINKIRTDMDQMVKYYVGRFIDKDISHKARIKYRKTEKKKVDHKWFGPYIPYVYLAEHNALVYI
jgi:uncharacterized protein (DUF1810 family)